jgi:ABC-type bacteriocin/lantibiotic exporter with double-glycine peptidase domain
MTKPRRIPAGAIKVPLPESAQVRDYTCGAACMQSVAAYFGALEKAWGEEELASVMGIASDVGAHPHNIVKGARRFGLQWEEKWPMTDAELLSYLDRGIPVLLMLQAWRTPDRRKRRWAGWLSEWGEGHWVVAIGYDREGVYFEDPVLTGARGFLPYEELFERWHDVGPYWRKPYEKYMYQYGIALWRRPVRRPVLYSRTRATLSFNASSRS